MRSFSNTVKAALAGGVVPQRYIVRVTLPGPTIWGASDGPAAFNWDNGSTGSILFYPLAEGMRITFPPVQAANRNDAAIIALSATDPGVLSQMFQQTYRAAPTDIAALIFDPTTGNPAEEILRWRGKMDTAELTIQPARFDAATQKLSPQIATLSMTVAAQTVDMKRGPGRSASDVDQRLFRDTNDGFFKDMAMAGISTINFGQSGPSSPASAAGNNQAPPPNILQLVVGAISGHPF